MTILDRVADLAQQLTGADMVVVCAVADGVCEPRVVRGVPDQQQVGCVCGLATEPVVLQDLTGDVDHPGASLASAGARSLASAPIATEAGEVLGAVTCLWRVAGAAAGSSSLGDLGALASSVVELERFRVRASEAEAEALATSAQKQRVSSKLSHDLRTPMTAILGFGELLRLESLSPNGVESVKHLLAAARKLLGMIDEVLDLNRLDQGEQTVAIEALALADVVNVARVAVARDAEEQGVHVVVDPSCTGLHVNSDRRRLQRVTMSLVGNAIDRAPSGATVTLSAVREGDRVRLRIHTPSADGAAPARAAGDPDGTRDGLTLSQRLMEAMDGSVGVDHDGGRTWWIEVPAAGSDPSQPSDDVPVASVASVVDVADQAPSEPESSPAPRTQDVLLYVEDDPANQQLVTRMFSRQPDLEVVTALDGRSGIAAARERQPGLVLLDLGLPDISGRDVLRTLKDDPSTSHIPVVVLSGEAEADRPAELERAGAAAYVTKPFNVRAMLDLVLGHLGRSS